MEAKSEEETQGPADCPGGHCDEAEGEEEGKEEETQEEQSDTPAIETTPDPYAGLTEEEIEAKKEEEARQAKAQKVIGKLGEFFFIKAIKSTSNRSFRDLYDI